MELFIVITMADDNYPSVKSFTNLDQAKQYAKTLSDQWTIERHTGVFSYAETIIDWG
jgi:hypothetical protein